MSNKENELPTLIRKQSEKALVRLNQSIKLKNTLTTDFKGTRIFISEVGPHPVQPKNIKLPFALLDYKPQGWSLLFRGSNGAWQIFPDDCPTKTIDDKISAILTDTYGVFWRQ